MSVILSYIIAIMLVISNEAQKDVKNSERISPLLILYWVQTFCGVQIFSEEVEVEVLELFINIQHSPAGLFQS